MNWCCVGGDDGTDTGCGVEQGETDTELVEALVSDGEGLEWWVHTSETAADATDVWIEGGALVTVAGVVLGTAGALALSLLICDGSQ